MSLLEQVKPILSVKDDDARQRSVLAWYNTLSSDEQEQLRSEIAALGDAIIAAFQPITEYLGEIAPKMIKALQDWVENNPELKAYLETLEQSQNPT